MMETADLILDTARVECAKQMFHNVWKHPESARYMLWSVSEDEAEAVARTERTIAFQKTHETWWVYEKASGEPIGFCGVQQIAPRVAEECGVCLGPAFFRKGYGTQILQALIEYSLQTYGAQEFRCRIREENIPSIRLAESLGFSPCGEEISEDVHTGQPCRVRLFAKKLEMKEN